MNLPNFDSWKLASPPRYEDDVGSSETMASFRNRKRARDELVTRELLEERARTAAKGGFAKAKWIVFCEDMLARGFSVRLYEARETFNKYITIESGGRSFKVRFSNHPPAKFRDSSDCDFIVGVTDERTTTTADAIIAVLKFFGVEQA